MSIKELKKGNLEEVSGSLSKYVIDSETIVKIGILNKQIINDEEKVVIKVSNISNYIDNEIRIYKILQNNNIIGILDYYSFCRKDGNDMKVLIMKYAEDGSFGLYNWKSNDIEKVKSCIKQIICSLVDAYIKVGFVHFDLNNNNFVLIKTTKKEIKYLINGKEIIIKIPKNGFETAIMDLEDCEINQDIYKFIKSLDKLFSRIKDVISIEKEWNQYAINIDSKMIELRELSINDNSKNDELAMRVLEILEIL